MFHLVFLLARIWAEYQDQDQGTTVCCKLVKPNTQFKAITKEFCLTQSQHIKPNVQISYMIS